MKFDNLCQRLRGGGGTRRRKRKGATLVEMALVLMMLICLTMGSIEFGWYVYARHVIQSAARDGARRAILSGATDAQVRAAVDATMAAAGFSGTQYTTTFARAQPTGGTFTYTTVSSVAAVPAGDGVRVTVSATFQNFRVRPLGVIAANKPVTGISTMVKEGTNSGT